MGENPLVNHPKNRNGGRGKSIQKGTGRASRNKLDASPRCIKRTFGSVCQLICSWKEKFEEREELKTVWNWLEKKAKEEEKSLHEMPLFPCDLRLTLTYMKCVLDEIDITAGNLRVEACASLDDYLKWDMSEIAKFTRRQETLKIKDRLKSHFPLIEKELVKSIKAGNQTAITTWSKLTGNYMGESDAGDAFRVIKVQDSYHEEPLPEIPVEVTGKNPIIVTHSN